VKQCVEDLITNKHGAPNSILYDAYTEFKNYMIQELAYKKNISWVYCSPRHHKTIGNIKRTNRTLYKNTGNYALSEIPTWKILDKATYAINIFINRSLTFVTIYLEIAKK
jgi:hypothetical protein